MKPKMIGNVKLVYDMLPRGCSHPITAQHIGERLNIQKRDVYGIINTLIMMYDVPVGGLRTSQHGYFIITNDDERHMAVEPLESHAVEVMARVNKLKHINLNDTA